MTIKYDSYYMSHITILYMKLDNRVILYLVIWIQKQGRSMRKKLLFIGFGSSVLHFVFRHLEFMRFYFLVLMLNLKQEKLKKIQGKYLKISIPPIPVVQRSENDLSVNFANSYSYNGTVSTKYGILQYKIIYIHG